VHVDQGLGVAFAVCTVASALLAIVAGRMLKARNPGWVRPATVALVLGLAAIALQCIEYLHQSFGPTNGAFASVFCAWTAMYMIAALATMYWLETHIATELRARRTPAGSGDIKDPDRLIAPGLDACVFYWSFLAGIGLLMYVVLYLV
jgi:heme/copper-type cytochrome/quinol oxidase subunit 3